MVALVYLSLLFLVALLSSLLLAGGREERTNPAIRKLPPGPAKLPIIGNLHQIRGNLPHQSFWEISKQYGPLMHLKLGQVSAVVVSSAALARDVLQTFDVTCCSRPHNVATSEFSYGRSDIAFIPYGERWRQLRKLCTVEFFSARKINSFTSVREDEIAKMAKHISSCISSSLAVDVSELSLCFSCNTICRTAFGRDIAGDDLSVYDVLREAQEVVTSFFVADYFPLLGWVDVATGMKSRLRKSFLELDGIYQKFIDRHIDSKSRSGSENDEDLMDVLIRLQKDGKLTEENLKGILMNIFIAGTDTSSSVVEWAMAELIRLPELMKRAQEEVRSCVGRSKGKVEESDLHQLHYLKRIIKETMRLHTPAPLLIKETMHPVTLSNGYQIPPKTTIYVNAWAIGRDPDAWERPEVFDPERFVDMEPPAVDSFAHYDFKLIPFGEGRRICPGKNLGMLIVELALANLLYSFDWQLPPGMREEEVSLEEAPGVAVHRKHALCLIAIKSESMNAA
ncbi:cytochrome P450 71A1-like [Curcuma longa]|uniref:cytochrome P450 71A1-like n=1 Tax=Curcuma longa TaxID=136217 RepID=UPI003D9E59E5